MQHYLLNLVQEPVESFVEDAILAFWADGVMFYAKDLAYRDELAFVLAVIIDQNQSRHSSDNVVRVHAADERDRCEACCIAKVSDDRFVFQSFLEYWRCASHETFAFAWQPDVHSTYFKRLVLDVVSCVCCVAMSTSCHCFSDFASHA